MVRQFNLRKGHPRITGVHRFGTTIARTDFDVQEKHGEDTHNLTHSVALNPIELNAPHMLCGLWSLRRFNSNFGVIRSSIKTSGDAQSISIVTREGCVGPCVGRWNYGSWLATGCGEQTMCEVRTHCLMNPFHFLIFP